MAAVLFLAAAARAVPPPAAAVVPPMEAAAAAARSPPASTRPLSERLALSVLVFLLGCAAGAGLAFFAMATLDPALLAQGKHAEVSGLHPATARAAPAPAMPPLEPHHHHPSFNPAPPLPPMGPPATRQPRFVPSSAGSRDRVSSYLIPVYVVAFVFVLLEL